MFYGIVDICRRYSWHGPEEGFDYIIIYDPRSVHIAHYALHNCTHNMTSHILRSTIDILYFMTLDRM